jgi:hypothetical protein
MSDSFITKNIVIFDGSNYGIWEAQIMFYLQGKKLWKVIRDRPMELKDGEKAGDKDAEQRFEDWANDDEEARGRICSLVSPKYHEQLRGIPTAAGFWDAIKDIGQHESITNAMIIRQQFASAELEEGGDLMEHLGVLERCQRLLAITAAPVQEGEISSLPKSWQPYVEGLRAKQNLISRYDEFKKALISEMNYRVMMGHGNGGGRSALFTKKQGKQTFSGLCDNCGKKGHKKRDCWAKGGGKEGQGPRQRKGYEKGKDHEANNVSKRFCLNVFRESSKQDLDWILS